MTGVVTVESLVHAYLRFKDWMDYDVEHSAYCAKEIIVLQALFGTEYVKVPHSLIIQSYEELLASMEKRQILLGQYTDEVHTSHDEDVLRDILNALEKYAFKSAMHYFTTGFEAIQIAIASAYIDDKDGTENIAIDESIIDDHFEEVGEDDIERIRDFIVMEHPEVEFMSFPAERLHEMGLPISTPPNPFE